MKSSFVRKNEDKMAEEWHLKVDMLEEKSRKQLAKNGKKLENKRSGEYNELGLW